MNRFKYITILVLIIITIGGFWGYKTWHTSDDVQRYRTQILAQGDIQQSVTATGTLNPVRVVRHH